MKFVGCGHYTDCADKASITEEPETETVEQDAVSFSTQAQFWAPVIYQDTHAPARRDYITNFDYDGDYVAKNNWERLNAFYQYAYVYYSVSQTLTHWFIGYYFFHPQDSDNGPHENDLEGVILAVRRTGGNGTLEHMITLAHDHFYQYTAAGAADGTDNIDATSISCAGGSCATGHPMVFIEAGGHGAYSCTDTMRASCTTAPGGDGLVYALTTGPAQVPGLAGHPDGSGAYQPSNPVGYRLIAMDSSGSGGGPIGEPISALQGFWYLQNHICETCTFEEYGVVRGDEPCAFPSCTIVPPTEEDPQGEDCSCAIDAAKMPWIWDDPDDGEVFPGDMICDPAAMFDVQMNSLGTFSHVYSDHRYWTHKVENIRGKPLVDADASPDPFAADIYVKVASPVSGEDLVLDSRAWLENDIALNVWSSLMQYGTDQATGQTEYGDAVYSHYFCRQTKRYDVDGDGAVTTSYNAGPSTTVTAYDWDTPTSSSTLFTATASASSSDGSCNLDDDTTSPPGQPNDLSPLQTMYDFTCDNAANGGGKGRVSFELTRVKRPDVSSSSMCASDPATCTTIFFGMDCSCFDSCRAAGTCCADKVSVCGGW